MASFVIADLEKNTELDKDAMSNVLGGSGGVVDTADYTVWRNNFGTADSSESEAKIGRVIGISPKVRILDEPLS